MLFVTMGNDCGDDALRRVDVVGDSVTQVLERSEGRGAVAADCDPDDELVALEKAVGRLTRPAAQAQVVFQGRNPPDPAIVPVLRDPDA